MYATLFLFVAFAFVDRLYLRCLYVGLSLFRGECCGVCFADVVCDRCYLSIWYLTWVTTLSILICRMYVCRDKGCYGVMRLSFLSVNSAFVRRRGLVRAVFGVSRLWPLRASFSASPPFTARWYSTVPDPPILPGFCPTFSASQVSPRGTLPHRA